MPQSHNTMRIVDLDARHWTTALDFYHALNTAFGAPESYGSNVNCLLEMLVWDHAFPNSPQKISPPYTIRVHDSAALPTHILSEIDLLRNHLLKAREEFRARRGCDIEVTLDILP